jgi:hypothetical protein
VTPPIVTGANIFRAKKILTPAEIFGLDTTPVLIAPNFNSKVAILPVAVFSKLVAGTEPYTPTSDASATLSFGPSGGLPACAAPIFPDGLAAGLTAFQVTPYAADIGFFPSGQGLYLVSVAGSFTTGSVTAATVTPGNAGLLYAVNDEGTIAGGDGTAVYRITAVTAGAVNTVTVSGGAGYVPATGVATTVTTGAGDGTLELNITAIRQLGNGTLEIDVLYQPI